METIYDYNPTRHELMGIIGKAFTKEEYLRFFHNSEDAANYHLVDLFVDRRDKENFNRVLAKIDPITRADIMRVVTHPM